MLEAPEQNLPGCGEQVKIGDSSTTLINRVITNVPKCARELVIAVSIALSVMTNVVVIILYVEAEDKVTQAYKDIKTQVWVKQDKEDERFQKFIAGPYAELAGQVRANQILFSKCKESK